MIGAACSAREADELGPNCRPAGAEDRGHIYGAARRSSDAGAHTEKARICAEIAGAFVPLQAKVFGDYDFRSTVAHCMPPTGESARQARGAAAPERRRRMIALALGRWLGDASGVRDECRTALFRMRGESEEDPRHALARVERRQGRGRRRKGGCGRRGGGGRCIECRCTHASCRRQGKSGAPI